MNQEGVGIIRSISVPSEVEVVHDSLLGRATEEVMRHHPGVHQNYEDMVKESWERSWRRRSICRHVCSNSCPQRLSTCYGTHLVLFLYYVVSVSFVYCLEEIISSPPPNPFSNHLVWIGSLIECVGVIICYPIPRSPSTLSWGKQRAKTCLVTPLFNCVTREPCWKYLNYAWRVKWDRKNFSPLSQNTRTSHPLKMAHKPTQDRQKHGLFIQCIIKFIATECDGADHWLRWLSRGIRQIHRREKRSWSS